MFVADLSQQIFQGRTTWQKLASQQRYKVNCNSDAKSRGCALLSPQLSY
ncbi:hypothetical protein Xszus_01228 [Xenorhabdus szentirmaii]|nr:hypothetical protein Xszus_01228 [Xenorhabdus szentirmaii]